MRRTTIIGGIGGAVLFPTVVFLLAYNMPSFKPAFLFLIFPSLLVMDVLPYHGEGFPFFIVIFSSLYLAALGFGLGAYLGSLFSKS